MFLAIGQAYNGQHKLYKKYAKELGINAFLFDIDTPNWLNVLDKKPDAFLWHADSKEENYRIIHDRVYFIEKYLKKPVFPDMNMYFAYGDKAKQAEIFQYHKIPTPKTFIAVKKEQALNFANKTKYPFILKDPYGYGGHHVFKIENKKQAKEYIDKIFSTGLTTKYSTVKNLFYAQEFLPVDKDLRVITVGPKVYCAYWRKSDYDWKHNIGQGGSAHFDNIPKSALNLCEKFSQKMKFHWMSYDIFVLPKNDIRVVEFSCNFGVAGATQGGYNVRKEQIKYIHTSLRHRVPGSPAL